MRGRGLNRHVIEYVSPRDGRKYLLTFVGTEKGLRFLLMTIRSLRHHDRFETETLMGFCRRYPYRLLKDAWRERLTL